MICLKNGVGILIAAVVVAGVSVLSSQAGMITFDLRDISVENIDEASAGICWLERVCEK